MSGHHHPQTEITGADTASRVHELAVPRHVTMHAERRVDGDGHHWVIKGWYPEGEQAFAEQIVPGELADSAVEAIRVQLARFRKRGW